MNSITKTLVLAVVVTLGHLGNAPSAYAELTISIAEVRGLAAYVKGSDAGKKQQIFWEGELVTKANGKGNFSFEGDLPEDCAPDDCEGMLTAGDTTIWVPLAYQSSEPPNQSDDELELIDVRPVSHDGDAVRAVGFVVDGAEVRVVSGGSDGHLRYWKLDPMMEVVDLALPNIPYDLDVFDDGGMYIVATGEGGWKGHAGSDTLRILDASGSPLMQTQVPIGFVYSVAFSPLGWWGWIAASGFYGDIVMYRTSDLQLYATTATKKKRTQALAFSPDGSFVATASTAGIQLRSFPSDCALDDCELDLLLTLSHSGSWSFSIAFRPDSTSERIEMVSGTDSGKTKFWFIENVATNPTASLVRSLDSGAVYALAWSPDGDRIVAGEGGDITVYDSTDLDDLRILFRNVDAHAGRVNDVAFSPDNSMIVSGGADGALKLWMFPTP